MRKLPFLNYALYALAPLAILFALVSIACVLSYGILMMAGDVWQLHRMISKITQLLLVLSIFPLRHFLKLSWADLGFAPKAVFFRQMAIGFGVGFLTLLPVFGLLYLLEVQVWDVNKIWTIGSVLKKTGIALLLALLISYVEEPIFRGVLLSSLQQKMAIWAAVFLSAAYYSSLHFFESHTEVAYQDITLSRCFMLFGEAIANWLNPLGFSAFVGLLMVGIFLAVIRSRVSQSLGLCVGLHASWVWQIKISKLFLNIHYDSPYAYLVSHYDGLVGFLIAGWLMLATLLFLKNWQRLPENF